MKKYTQTQILISLIVYKVPSRMFIHLTLLLFSEKAEGQW